MKYRIAGRLDDRGRPGATLSLTGQLELECQRCGAPFAFRLERDAVFRFVASEEELNAVPIDDDEEAEAIVGGHSADLVAWIEDETILSLPLVPRHDDCKPIGVESGEERRSTRTAKSLRRAGRSQARDQAALNSGVPLQARLR